MNRDTRNAMFFLLNGSIQRFCSFILIYTFKSIDLITIIHLIRTDWVKQVGLLLLLLDHLWHEVWWLIRLDFSLLGPFLALFLSFKHKGLNPVALLGCCEDRWQDRCWLRRSTAILEDQTWLNIVLLILVLVVCTWEILHDQTICSEFFLIVKIIAWCDS